MRSLIDLEIVNTHICIVTLNRPEAANALSKLMLKELNEILLYINQNKKIYCTIITGVNDKVFCAGADLKERKKMSETEVIDAVSNINRTVLNVEQMNMPVIAAINGAAFGGGLELALACDFRYVAEHALMGLTETSLAIIPGAGGTQRLSRLIGAGQAKRIIYTAERISAKKSLEIGLVEHVSSANELITDSINTATEIIKNGPIALEQAKTAINKGLERTLTEGLAIEHECYKKTIYTNDRLEGLKAFAEKRKPSFNRN